MINYVVTLPLKLAQMNFYKKTARGDVKGESELLVEQEDLRINQDLNHFLQ